jgi:hypothetical protein
VDTYILSHGPPSSPYLLPYAWKRKRDGKKREREKEMGEKTGSQRYCFPFLLEPQRSRIGLPPPLCWAIYKNL